MIDIENEKLILVSELPKHLPKRGSKPVHISAVYRWMKKGLVGVRLETIFYCGNRYTTMPAVNRFWQAVTAAKEGSRPMSCSKQAKKVASELDDAGW